MIFALAGNPNCGKTALFNSMTGENQHVGNFPGVTVEKKSGNVKFAEDCTLVDLPGVYSLHTFTKEEIVAKDYIVNEKPDCIINVVDATNLERNLYLSLQLIELEIPIVIALNMMDEVKKNGESIDITYLSEMLGVEVVPTCAIKGEGIKELASHAYSAAKNKQCGKKTKKQSLNWLSQDDMYCFIDNICINAVNKPEKSKVRKISFRMDKILTGKYLAFPSFVVIMFLIFHLTFNVIGKFFGDFLQEIIHSLSDTVGNFLLNCNVNNTICSLVTDGIFTGVGSVLGFLPVVITLFFFMSILEDTGYMARIAFIMDKPMHAIGLSGKSIVPILLGFGCSVPAILASRTLSSERDRYLTLMFIPFVSCSAKIPVYAFFVDVFFEKYRALIMLCLYILGITMGVLSTAILKSTVLKGEMSPIIMELPDYRFPSLKSVFKLIRNKTKDFIQKAFTVIFLSSIVIWFMQTFDVRMNVVSDSSESILAFMSKAITPIFSPLGFSDWRITASLISGITAKEAVVSTLQILMGSEFFLGELFSPASAMSFLIFTLLYTPCIAAVFTMKRELNSAAKTAAVILTQCITAWLAAFIFYNIITNVL